MTALGLLLLVCEVSAPLGPYARPGVPVVLEVSGDVDQIVLAGWRYAATKPRTIVHPPFLPCTVLDGEGRELLRLEAVPEGTLLVGVVGAAPPDLKIDGAVLVENVRAAEIDHWPALDLFDHLVLPAGAPLEGPLLDWSYAGGAIGYKGQAIDARPALVPRLGNVAPEVFDAIERPSSPSPAFAPAGTLVLATLAILGLQLLLAARGMIGRRALLRVGVFVVAVAAVVGFFATRAVYRATAPARIDVLYRGPCLARTLTFRAHTAVGPGAEVVPEPDQVPLFYRSAGEPWWSSPSRVCRFDEGVIRLFSSLGGEAELPAGEPDDETGTGGPLSALVPRLTPARGRWEVSVWGWRDSVATILLVARN